MTFLNSILKNYLKLQMPRLQRFIEKPIETQQRLFRGLIQKARYTEVGKKYDFKSIKTIEIFAQRLPIGDYDSHKPFIQRMMHGESDILWTGKIQWFSKSSGTTNDKSKFLPVSYENLRKCHLQGPADSMTLFYHNFPDATVFEGKGMIMGGSHEVFKPYPKTRFGDVSAIMIENMPQLPQRLFYTPTLDVALMGEWEAKIEKIAQEVMSQNVTNIGGVPTWTIVLFKRILELTGKENMSEVWNNLQVYFHGGVSFEPYRTQFKNFLPSEKVKYFEVYNASEGYFASQDRTNANDMLLLLDNGIYYEFLPISEWEKEHPIALPLEKIEIGQNYAMLITTNAGLWRYKTGDTVIFTSKNPYRIKITGRTKHFINAFGEEVMVANTDQALAMTCLQLNSQMSEYTVAPVYFKDRSSGGGHEWLIEFDKEPASLTQFEDFLDRNLQSINSDYEAKRYKNIALQRLTVRSIPKGTFYKWLKAKGKYGGQHKVPRLANDRRYLDEILAFLDEVTY